MYNTCYDHRDREVVMSFYNYELSYNSRYYTAYDRNLITSSIAIKLIKELFEYHFQFGSHYNSSDLRYTEYGSVIINSSEYAFRELTQDLEEDDYSYIDKFIYLDDSQIPTGFENAYTEDDWYENRYVNLRARFSFYVELR